MPSFDQYPESDLIKGILMGDTGAGKTGALCALAAAGYNVRILDLDKGAQIIKGYVTEAASIYLQPRPGMWAGDRAIASRMNYVTIQETMTNIKGRPVPKGDSWQKIMDQLTEWKDLEGGYSYGMLEKWTPRDILAIDSFSRFCDARMYLELVMNGRAISGRHQSDYFKVQDDIERVLEMLVGPGVRCHVLLLCHVDYTEKDEGAVKIVRGMPQAMGKALGPKVGQHFNHTLLARSQGSGASMKRKILTQTTGVIDLKNAAPLKVKPEYDLETGLLEYFQAVLGPETVKKQTGLAPVPPTPLPVAAPKPPIS